MILVTGFGPFQDVQANPSESLARAVHGRVVAGHRVVGAVLPVAWDAIPWRVEAWALRLRPALVVGTGVARGRSRVAVETCARPVATGRDVRGVEGRGALGDASRGPTLDAATLATALDADLSDDAGTYLCNAWLFEVPPRVRAPAAFVHLPDQDLPPERLLAALGVLLRAPDEGDPISR